MTDFERLVDAAATERRAGVYGAALEGRPLLDWERMEASAELLCVLRALEAIGWQAVPKVATKQMAEAGKRVAGEGWPSVYDDMLAAAPSLVPGGRP